MLSIEEKIEEIADNVELKFDLEKFYPFEDRIEEIFNKIEDNVNIYEAWKVNRGV